MSVCIRIRVRSILFSVHEIRFELNYKTFEAEQQRKRHVLPWCSSAWSWMLVLPPHTHGHGRGSRLTDKWIPGPKVCHPETLAGLIVVRSRAVSGHLGRGVAARLASPPRQPSTPLLINLTCSRVNYRRSFYAPNSRPRGAYRDTNAVN